MNIVFTIKTSYSEENYFLTVDKNKSIEMQIDEALAEICFCDAYEIVSYKEATEEYMKKRNELIAEYEKIYEPIEEAFCSGHFVTLETLKDDIKWRESR